MITRNLILITLLLMTGALTLSAQNLTPTTQATFDAFVHMASAISNGSPTKLREAIMEIRKCPLDNFSSLEPKQEELSLDGHMVFNESFALAVLEKKDCFRMAQKYKELQVERQVSADDVIYFWNGMVAGKSSVKYTFSAKGRQDIAVVAEPGGRLTLRIYDTTHGKWYNDTLDVHEGRPTRVMVLPLREDEDSDLEIEIINTTLADESFVLLCN